MCNKFWCSVFGKHITTTLDIIKHNKIQKLADKVKYTSKTSAMQQWTTGIKIKMSSKSKIKNPAN